MILKAGAGASVVSVLLAFATLFASLALAPARAGAQVGCSVSTFTSSDVPMAIPDPGVAESALVVPAGDAVAAVAVHVTITHPFDSDLKLELVSPPGKVVTLAEAVGLWGHDFTNTVFDDTASTSIISQLPPFTGTFRPAEPLADLVGSPRGGTWTLRVADLRARYSGQLVGWGLEVTGCAVPPARPPKAVGAPDPPPLPTGVPAGHIPAEGMVVTVTTNSDQDGGDVSSVAHLLANPGSDGAVSLREAIKATNNDPGIYTIRFAPALKGRSIDIADALGLTPLSGGGVLVDGDIDGDGRPDVTIRDLSPGDATCGLILLSSGNRLHGMGVQGFSCGIQLSTPFTLDGVVPSNVTLEQNIVSGIEVTSSDLSGNGIAEGIILRPNYGHPECYASPCNTHNTWADIRLVGNRVTSDGNGIEVPFLSGTIGDVMERFTIAGNDVRMTPRTTGRFAINVAAGADENRISGAMVAYNRIEVQGAGNAINLVTGQGGGSANVMEDVAILANRLGFSAAPAIPQAAQGILFVISDGCSNCGGPDIDWSHGDTVRRVRIVDNLFEGQDTGVVVNACCSGPSDSALTDLRIAGNVIRGVVRPHELDPWGIEIAGRIDVSNVSVDSNTIVQQTTQPEADASADLAGGGIVLVGVIGGSGGGLGSPDTPTALHDVSVANNRIDTDLAGIAVLGGAPSDDRSAAGSWRGNVFRVLLRGNLIERAPVLATRWDPNAKGINVIGGLGGTPPASGGWTSTTQCGVTQVALAGNLVAGVPDDVWVVSNFGEGASGNVAELGPPPRIPTILPVPTPPPAPINGRP